MNIIARGKLGDRRVALDCCECNLRPEGWGVLVALSLRHLLLLNPILLEQDLRLNHLSEFPRPPHYRSIRQLETDIKAFIEAHNEDPKSYRWFKSADQILATVKRFYQKADATLCAGL
jgi:hypothetical protein